MALKVAALISFVAFLAFINGQTRAETTISTDSLTWTLSNLNGSITVPATVPGGVYTDLMNGGVLTNGDFYYRYNDFEYRWVSYEDWVYSTNIDLPISLMGGDRIVFQFDGLDTKAEILLNDNLIYECSNMFTRCTVDIKPYLTLPATVNLKIVFHSPVNYSENEYNDYYSENGYYVLPTCVDPEYRGECHVNHIRKMQSSFSWDWGPAFPSMGIWLPWKILSWSSLKINNIYFESDPISPLPEKYDPNFMAAWTVYFKIYYDLAPSSGTVEGSLRITLDGRDYYYKDITIDASTTENMKRIYGDYFVVPEDTVETWWPNGYGGQPLYELTAVFTPTNVIDSGSNKSINVGFRTVELDESFVNASAPSIGRYYRAKVNNIFIFLLGSNWIPAHVLPEQVTPEYTRRLLTDARDTFQNSLRIWGGGIYETEDFYQIADELGILLWHDLMFACNMYPVDSEFLNRSLDEVYYQVERLQYHPNILLWATNNENEAALKGNWYGTDVDYSQYKKDYIKLYVDTITTNLREADPSRSVIVSSPSNGLASEEAGYIAENPYDEHYGDTHFYDYVSNAWNYETYPSTRMATEYGFQSFPSYQTLLPVFAEEDMMIDSPMLEHRQHHPNGQEEFLDQLQMHFDYDPSTTSFQYYLYLIQLHQAMGTKTETEYYRRLRDTLNADGSGLTMGALYWQLNDIWQGASWASIEYGGRWKMLHNYVKKFFNPLTIIPWIQDGRLKVSLVNDMPTDVLISETGPLTIEIRFVLFNQESSNVASYDITTDIVSQSAITGIDLDLETDLDAANICSEGEGPLAGDPFDNCFVLVTLIDPPGITVPDNFLLLGEPKSSYLPPVDISVTFEQETDDTINLSVTADRLAMFVFLESPFDGVFSDNGFILPWSQQIDLQFYGRESVPIDEFQNTLNVTYLRNSYDALQFPN